MEIVLFDDEFIWIFKMTTSKISKAKHILFK